MKKKSKVIILIGLSSAVAIFIISKKTSASNAEGNANAHKPGSTQTAATNDPTHVSVSARQNSQSSSDNISTKNIINSPSQQAPQDTVWVDSIGWLTTKSAEALPYLEIVRQGNENWGPNRSSKWTPKRIKNRHEAYAHIAKYCNFATPVRWVAYEDANYYYYSGGNAYEIFDFSVGYAVRKKDGVILSKP
jgi:hypothetical protein